MNPDRLLALYDRVADAPDAVSRLRRFVLDLAVRGKLVEQDPADEPAWELLKRITEEKAHLVKSGKVRKQKIVEPLEPEQLFSTPNGWFWVRLHEIGITQTGTSPSSSKPELFGDFIPFVKPADLDGSSINYDGPGLSEEGIGRSRVAPAGSVMMVCIGATLGKVNVTDRQVCFNQQINSLTPHLGGLLTFLSVALKSSDFQTQAWSKAGTGTLPIISKGKWELLPIPLPPLAEQQRIGAKVQELLALCDRLEEARTARESTRDRLTTASLARLSSSDTDNATFRSHARFAIDSLPALTARPDQVKHLRQTIHNLAVRGKLVEQDPTDEPASELLKQTAAEKARLVKAGEIRRPKPVSAVDEPLFELPCRWQWARLSDLSLRLHYGYTASANPKLNDVRLLRITDIQDNGVDWRKVPGCQIDKHSLKNYLLERGDLLIARTGGTIGKTFLISDMPVVSVFASYLIRVQPARSLFDQYIKLFCGSDIYWDQLREGSRGGAQPNVNGKTLGRMFVPVPPLAEQQCIVAKVDELMILCDRLEASLDVTDIARCNLIESILYEAVIPVAETTKGS